MGRDINDIINFIKEKEINTILYRIINEIEKKIGLKKLKFHPKTLEDVDCSKTIKEQIRLPYYSIDENLSEKYKEIFSLKDKERIINNANKICNGYLKILDIEVPSMNNIPKWNVCLDTKKRWQKKHWSKIKIYGKNPPGDCRTIWELNRLYYFQYLGRAYILTKDKKYLECFKSHLDNWIKENPLEVGINWYSNLEVAIRALNLFWTYLFFKDNLDDKYKNKILNLIGYHLYHVKKKINYTKKVITNNHLLGEASILYYFGLVFEEDQYKNIGQEIFIQEIKRQFKSDGGNFEGSLGYHKFSTYFLIIILTALTPEDKNYNVVKKSLKKALLFIYNFTDKNYTIPKIGDWDGANIFKLNSNPSNNIRSLLSYLNLFGINKIVDEEYFWLFGDFKGKSTEKFNINKNNKFQYFNKSGYVVVNSDGEKNSKVIFRIGNHGPHGHCDQLSFVWFLNNKNILIDPGSYIYNNKPNYRQYFRGTEAHNTIKFDNLEQSKQIGSFQWGKIREGKVLNFKEGNPLVLETILAYPEQNIKHKRMILIFKDIGLINIDIVNSKKYSKAKRFWHLSPSWDIIKKTNIIKMVNSSVNLYYYNYNVKKLKIFNGDKNTLKGWYCPEYGNLKQNYTFEEKLRMDLEDINIFCSLFVFEKLSYFNCNIDNQNSIHLNLKSRNFNINEYYEMSKKY